MARAGRSLPGQSLPGRSVPGGSLPGGHGRLALRQILGPARFDAALQQIQTTYGGSSITEPELEAVFHQWLPVRTGACQRRLSQFFSQWFDTAYPAGGKANRPMITGPGLAGPGFYTAGGTCA